MVVRYLIQVDWKINMNSTKALIIIFKFTFQFTKIKYLTTMAYGIIVAFACTATTATRALLTLCLKAPLVNIFFHNFLTAWRLIWFFLFKNKYFHSNCTITFSFDLRLRSQESFLQISLFVMHKSYEFSVNATTWYRWEI